MATAATVFRDYETDGVPASGSHKVKKSDVRQLLGEYESTINAFLSNGGLIYSSKAAMDADLAHGANSSAWVIGDATVANNGIYRKIGASGVGSWTRVADLPFSFIIASDAGAGTPNAIQATTSIPVSASALIWMNVFEANTSSPVTVSFNGGSALTIKTNSGNNVTAGGLAAGMIVMGIVSGSTFRLVSDQASAAIVAAAEDAADRAEAAAALAGAGQHYPELFPSWNASNAAAAIVAACNAAIAGDGQVCLTAGKTYNVTQVAIPAGVTFRAKGAVVRVAGSLTGSNIDVTIGNDCVFDELVISSPGTETNSDILRIGDRVRIDYLEVSADTQRGGGGIVSEGDHVHIGYVKTVNIDRPVHLWNTNVDFVKTGNHIGFLECDSYVRAFRGTFVSGVVGGIRATTRSPNASKSPGHNAFLIVGCPDLEIGDVWAEDTGEHVGRVGASEDPSPANLFPNPENVAGWSTITSATITSDASLAPDGTMTADRVTKAGVASDSPNNSVTVTAAAHTFSAYLKHISGSGWIRMRCSSSNASFWVNAQTGAIGSVQAGWSNVVMTDIGDGWYRASGTITTTAGAVTFGTIPVTGSGSSTADTGASDVWGVNVELGSTRTPYLARTRRLKIGRIFGIRSGGCVLKCNPTMQIEPGVTEKAYDCTVAGVFGVDVGEGSPEGNEELIRLTHAFGWKIGPSYAFRSDFTTTAQSLVRVNDINDVTIESVGGDNSASGSIIIDGTSDIDAGTFGGDIVDFHVLSLTGQTSGNDSIGVDTTFNLNRVSIHCDNHHGFAVNFLRWNAGALIGPFSVSGTVAGSVAPAFVTPPSSDNFTIDLQWQNKTVEGRATGARFTATREIIGALFSSASQAPSGLFLNNARGTPGAGTYGVAIEWSRLGSSRRGAAIVSKQGSADDKEVDIAFLVGDSSTTTNEALLEAMILRYTGRPSFPVLPTLTAYADNAAATAGGLAVGEIYRTSTGMLAVRI
jgi:hypothetical protein